MKRFAVIIVVILIAAAVLLRIFLSGSDSGTAGGRGGNQGSVAVRTENVIWGEIEEKREFSGTVKPAYSYVIAAKISGRLQNTNKRIGDHVGLNEVVGRIDDIEYRQSLQEAEALVKVRRASVDEAQAQLNHSLREKERVSELLGKGISSRAELDEIETLCASQNSRLDLAKAQLVQSEAALAQAKTRVAYTTLRAARGGLVAERHTDGGALLSINSPVLTVVGIDTVYVEIGITERDYMRIRKGQTAQVVVDAIPQRSFKGTITQTSPLFQSATRTAMAEVAIVNDSLLLKPGMFARIFVTTAKHDSTQIVPTQSIVSRNSKNFIFVIDKDDTVEMLPVSTGITNFEITEILSPLIDKKIVTVGQHLLVDGSSVIVAADSVQISGKGDHE